MKSSPRETLGFALALLALAGNVAAAPASARYFPPAGSGRTRRHRKPGSTPLRWLPHCDP
jgi:hypothetical protein